MFINKFVRSHISKILTEYEIEIFKNNTSTALDNFLRMYFKKNKSLGSKDRALIQDNVYNLIRYKVYLD